MIAMAVGVDAFGVGRQGSFGTGQFILMLFGGLLGAAGLAGPQRSLKAYRTFAVILLNSVVLLVALELTCIVVWRSGLVRTTSRLGEYPSLTYYQEQPWSSDFWRQEREAERYRYASFSLWRHEAYEGTLVNVDSSGIRRTPLSKCTPESYRIVFLGGSTAWGWGSPDWGTIPAYLQRGLNRVLDRPACITNLGEDGYVSTQGLIALMRHIQNDEIPDLVISYDGVNDLIAASESGRAGTHVRRSRIKKLFESRSHPLLLWFSTTRLYATFARLTGIDSGVKTIAEDHRDSRLAGDIARTYARTFEIAQAMGEGLGFDVVYVWQPHLLTGEKLLSPEEEEMRRRVDAEFDSLYRHVNSRVCSEFAPEYANLTCADRVFDGHSEQIWIDEWGHVTPRGNEIVAEFILDHIRGSTDEGTLRVEAGPGSANTR